jgi:hypothetical protein
MGPPGCQCGTTGRVAPALVITAVFALAGQLALVVTSPPYGPTVHCLVRHGADGVAKFDNTYGSDRGNLAYRDLTGLADGFRGNRNCMQVREAAGGTPREADRGMQLSTQPMVKGATPGPRHLKPPARRVVHRKGQLGRRHPAYAVGRLTSVNREPVSGR